MIDTNMEYCETVDLIGEAQAGENIESVVSQDTYVEFCVAYVWKNRALLGVVSKPLFSRTQRLQLEENLIRNVNDLYGFDEVLVSFDMDVIYEIGKLKKAQSVDDKEIASLFYSVKVRRDSGVKDSLS